MRFPDRTSASDGNGSRRDVPARDAHGGLDPAITQALETYRGTALPERIRSAAEYAELDREAQEAAILKRRIEDWFAPLVEQTHLAHKGLCDRRRAYTAELEAGIEARNRLLIDWRRMVDEKATESGAAILKAHVAQEGVSYRANWQARVVDAALVPRHYLMVDERHLAQVAKESKGTVTIPGVEFYDAGTIARRVK